MLCTIWNTQRGSWSSIDKRRGRKEIEVTRRRRGGVKSRERDPSVISSLSVLHSLEHPKRFTELGIEEKGEGGVEVIWGKKRRVKRGEGNQASNHTPK